jgi:hypothetical protein
MELRKIKKNKKASIEDMFFFIISMLGFALFIIIVAYVVPEITDEMRKTDLNNSAAIRSVFDEGDRTIDKLDAVYLIIFAGLVISLFITSFMINSHPIFIPIYIILFGFAIVVGVITNHVYDEFVANVDMATVAASQTYMVAIMNNFILILLGVGILNMIILFAKPFQRSAV